MPNPDEAREEAWRAFADEYTRWVVRGRGIDEPIEFDYAWDARGRYDEQRIAELDKRALLREWRSGKYALWRDDPAAIAGFSAGVDAALRALVQSEEVKP